MSWLCTDCGCQEIAGDLDACPMCTAARAAEGIVTGGPQSSPTAFAPVVSWQSDEPECTPFTVPVQSADAPVLPPIDEEDGDG